jgi:5-oxopent-3-ene-1,2,5-tricarboxylate decarboxylase/2-hydroxyhepta-2,4-diene-1,7-dioate isomerase
MKRVRIEHDGRAVEGTLDGDTVTADGTEIKISEVKRWLSPVTPSKILATHLTYRSRAEEYKMAHMPSEPSYFMKPPSSLSGHLAPVVRPAGCRFLNYEGEVAVVIGKTARNIRVADALGYVAGYSLANDFAIHDFRHADRGSMLRVKGADTLAPMGPGLVRGWTPDAQVLRTRVNGEVVQESSLDGMVFSVAYVVADLARMMTLVPGDVIFSGTPANSRPVEPGDVVTVECDGLGVLENRIAEGAHDVSDEAGWMPESSDKALGVALGIQLRE